MLATPQEPLLPNSPKEHKAAWMHYYLVVIFCKAEVLPPSRCSKLWTGYFLWCTLFMWKIATYTYWGNYWKEKEFFILLFEILRYLLVINRGVVTMAVVHNYHVRVYCINNNFTVKPSWNFSVPHIYNFNTSRALSVV